MNTAYLKVLLLLMSFCLSACQTGYSFYHLAENAIVPPGPPLPPGGTIISQKFDLVTPGTNGKLDILFVIDNSGSIGGAGDGRAEVELLKANFQNFANTYLNSGELDVCITVVSTDYYNNQSSATLRDVPCTGTAPTSQIISQFTAAVDMGTNGNSSERPYESIQRLLNDRPASSMSPAFRKDAMVALVIATDEAEQSGSPLNNNNYFVSVIKNYLNVLNQVTADHPWFVVAINNPVGGNNLCLGVQPSLPCEGARLNNLAAMVTNSFVADIAGGNNAYSNLLENIALTATPETRTVFPITYPPGPQVIIQALVHRASGGVPEILNPSLDYQIDASNLRLEIIRQNLINSFVVGDELEIKTRIQ